jgi:hypothetical protein
LVNGPNPESATIGGVDLGNLTDYMFYFGDARGDANWQGTTKGYTGEVED